MSDDELISRLRQIANEINPPGSSFIDGITGATVMILPSLLRHAADAIAKKKTEAP